MGANFARLKTWIAGETLTAAELNAEYDNILNNFDPDGMDDASLNNAAMDATADPFPGASQSLATALRGELQRIRFVLAQLSGEAKWYIDPDGSMASVFTNAATFAGKKTFSNNVIFTKGADVASAAALPLITDGNYFDVTGTDAIISIDTVGIGFVVRLHFDAALVLTHNATDLILPGAANITTAAGDEFTFVEYATGDWRCTAYVLATGKSVIPFSELKTAIATTSGTTKDFTGIPSWVKRITVMFAGVSTNGTSNPIIQLRGSGGFEGSGYLGTAGLVSVNAASAANISSTGFTLAKSHDAARVYHGKFTLDLENSTNNTWIGTGMLGGSDSTQLELTMGSKSITGTLTEIRLTTLNGTDAFDAGEINIRLE